MTELKFPPFVEVDGIHNFRDIGGYAISSSPSNSVRRQVVYRCAEPSRITDSGKKKLKEVGVSTFFDLRSKPEIEKQLARAPIPEIDGVTRQYVPAFAEIDSSPEKIALRYKDYAHGGEEGFAKAYKEILEHAGPSFRAILLHLRDYPDRPCVIHCTAGKDRTGVIVALILSIAGADDATIAREYELTEQGLLPMRPIIIEFLMKEPDLQDDREAALRMISSRAGSMFITLQMIRDTYGGATGYVKSHCGLSDEDIAAIAQNMISNEPPIH